MADQKDNKQAAAFGARIDNYYEDMFNEILEKYKDSEGNVPRGAKKSLLEMMISNYVRGERNKTKEEALALESEINLIAENLNNILGIFKNIRSKAQDTLIAERESGKQKVLNLTTELDTANSKIVALEEENNSLKTSNDAFNDVKENLTSQIEKLSQEVESEKATRLELEKELKGLKNVEKLNLSLEKELENTKNQLNSVKNISIDKDSKINKLENKLQDLSEELKDLSNKKDKEIKEIGDKIRKEAEIDVKQTKLDSTMQINTMQLELIKATKELNNKESELKEVNETISVKENKIIELNSQVKGLNDRLEQLQLIYSKK